MLDHVTQHIKSSVSISGIKLIIKPEKTNITEFYLSEENIKYRPYQPTKLNSMKKMEYLGFSFDGENALIRDGTISGYYRKMTWGVRKEAKNLVARYPNKTPSEILKLVNIPLLCQKYSRIENYEPLAKDYSDSNFWSYTKRSYKVMGSIGKHIFLQLRNKTKTLKFLLEQEIQRQYLKSQQIKNSK